MTRARCGGKQPLQKASHRGISLTTYLSHLVGVFACAEAVPCSCSSSPTRCSTCSCVPQPHARRLAPQLTDREGHDPHPLRNGADIVRWNVTICSRPERATRTSKSRRPSSPGSSTLLYPLMPRTGPRRPHHHPQRVRHQLRLPSLLPRLLLPPLRYLWQSAFHGQTPTSRSSPRCRRARSAQSASPHPL